MWTCDQKNCKKVTPETLMPFLPPDSYSLINKMLMSDDQWPDIDEGDINGFFRANKMAMSQDTLPNFDKEVKQLRRQLKNFLNNHLKPMGWEAPKIYPNYLKGVIPGVHRSFPDNKVAMSQDYWPNIEMEDTVAMSKDTLPNFDKRVKQLRNQLENVLNNHIKPMGWEAPKIFPNYLKGVIPGV
ncbi:unnamed protein product [Meganyctiphanes norvegica]|uniref:Uncharacterized protein n=1 Tax=Meganyctiphanes norvegica TaxID=48144 RepID=A0AAV2QDS0_MEGNR